MAHMVIKSSTGREEAENVVRVLVDGESDLTDLSEAFAPGSVAFTADMEYIWVKDLHGAWQAMA